MDFCPDFAKLQIQNIPDDSNVTGCAPELCQCEYFAKIVKSFVPLHFGSYNTRYEPTMYHADGTKCGCDEYSIAGMYNKLRRNCDLGAFDNGVHVKLPTHKIVWEPNEKTSVYYPVCKPNESYGRGVLGPFSHIQLFLEHRRLNKMYKAPTDLQLCQDLLKKPTLMKNKDQYKIS